MTRALGMLGLALLLAAAPVAAQRAAAQSCSGGGSSGGGGGGSSSGGGGGYDDSSSSDVEVCRDTTAIHGLAECRGFGDGWDASGWPTLELGAGLQMDGLSLSDRSYGGTAMHDENPYGWTMGGEDVAAGPATGLRLRGLGFLTPWLYTGFELGFGIGDASGPRLAIGELEVEPTSVVVLDAGAVTGFAIPVGPVVLRPEVLVGVRGVGLQVETQRGSCVGTASEWHAELAVAPRLGVDVFVTPWLSVGAYGGSHLIGTGDWHGGVDLRLHTRSYGGQRTAE